MSDHTTVTTMATEDVPARRVGERRRANATDVQPREDRRRVERRQRIPGFFGLVRDLLGSEPTRR